MIVEKKDCVENDTKLVVLRIEGMIKLGESAQFFAAALEHLRSDNILMDFATIDEIDSTGLGELVGVCVAFANAGRTIQMQNISPRIIKLLQTARAPATLKVIASQESDVARYLFGTTYATNRVFSRA